MSCTTKVHFFALNMFGPQRLHCNYWFSYSFFWGFFLLLQIKCHQYWPDVGSIMFGDIQVTLTESTYFPTYIKRTFSLLHAEVSMPNMCVCLPTIPKCVCFFSCIFLQIFLGNRYNFCFTTDFIIWIFNASNSTLSL